MHDHLRASRAHRAPSTTVRGEREVLVRAHREPASAVLPDRLILRLSGELDCASASELQRELLLCLRRHFPCEPDHQTVLQPDHEVDHETGQTPGRIGEQDLEPVAGPVSGPVSSPVSRPASGPAGRRLGAARARIEVDLVDVDFIDLAGARALRSALDGVRAGGGEVTVRAARPLVRLVLLHAGMDPQLLCPAAANRGALPASTPTASFVSLPTCPSASALRLVVRQVRLAVRRGDVHLDSSPAQGWPAGPRLLLQRLQRLTQDSGRQWCDLAR